MTEYPQFITLPDGQRLAVLPEQDFNALVANAEDAMDAAAAREGREQVVAEGAIPAPVSSAIRRGDHPIIAWRKFRKMTQTDLGKAADLTQAAISRLEKEDVGAGKPETIAAIAKALDAPEWTLLDNAGEGEKVRGVGGNITWKTHVLSDVTGAWEVSTSENIKHSAAIGRLGREATMQILGVGDAARPEKKSTKKGGGKITYRKKFAKKNV